MAPILKYLLAFYGLLLFESGNATTDGPTTEPTHDPTLEPTLRPTTFSPTTRSPTIHPTTPVPTYNIIHGNGSNLFVVPNITGSFAEAQSYCNSRYHGLANIYDPKENDYILQLVNLNHLGNAFIGYFKEGTEWRWQSNVSSDPHQWLSSPLAAITSNIEYPETECMSITRYGWQYTNCDADYYFVCIYRYTPNLITLFFTIPVHF